MAVMTVSVPISIERAGTAPEKTTTQGRFFALDLLDNRFAALHGLRVLAIVSVVAYHVTWIFMGEQHIALDPGFFAQSIAVFFGMDLFFVLSGFVIAYSQRNIHITPAFVGNFALRRSLRLELIVVVLIAFEIVGTFYQIYAARGH